tara:strand:+ start:47 stop:526 length:480 start_codon:yes stop_codon:yes gene_type:complete
MKQLIEDSLTYDPDTGMFKWLDVAGSKNCRKSRGWFYGYQNKLGYYSIRVNGRPWYAHRLAWYLMKGKEAPEVIDHIDRNPSNNKLDNLRAVTQRVNLLNSERSDKAKHVYKLPNSRWASYINYKGKKQHLGVFDTEEEATEKARHVKLNNRYRDEQQA